MCLPCHTNPQLYVNSLLALQLAEILFGQKFVHQFATRISQCRYGENRSFQLCAEDFKELGVVCDSSNAGQYCIEREGKSMCVPMLDGTPGAKHFGLSLEFPALKSNRMITLFVAVIFMAAVFSTMRNVVPECHQRLQREEHSFAIVGNKSFLSCQPQPFRSSFHFQPPKNWMNG